MKLPYRLHQLRQRARAAIKLAPQPLYLGIDVSEFNGAVDFRALRSRIDFAILRCGYGSDYCTQDDSCFERNVQACQEARIPYGVYLYAYAKNKDTAKSEASHMIRLIRGTDPAFGVWYDVEDMNLLQSADLVGICKTWCDAMLDAGVTCVGLYASVSVMKSRLNSPELDQCERWVAQWGPSCDYPNPGIWQFTDRAKLDGKFFDMNYAYKDYPYIRRANMAQE